MDVAVAVAVAVGSGGRAAIQRRRLSCPSDTGHSCCSVGDSSSLQLYRELLHLMSGDFYGVDVDVAGVVVDTDVPIVMSMQREQ